MSNGTPDPVNPTLPQQTTPSQPGPIEPQQPQLDAGGALPAPAEPPIAQHRRGLLEPTEFYGLLRVVIVDTTLTPAQKKSLIDELRKSTPASDRWTFRWAIWILGLAVLLSIGTLWDLSAGGYNIPDGLVAIGSGAAGGLAGLLTSGRNSD